MSVRVRDWKTLGAAHRRRSELITVIFDSESGAFAPPEYHVRRGKPFTYSDAHIEALLTAKLMLRLSLRAVGGFARGLARFAKANWPVPNYNTRSGRESSLWVNLGHALATGKLHVLHLDSTGLKVFGEGHACVGTLLSPPPKNAARRRPCPYAA